MAHKNHLDRRFKKVDFLSRILKNFGYHIIFSKRDNYDKTHFGKKPVWNLIIYRKKEVIQLLKEIPFKHEEKRKKLDLIGTVNLLLVKTKQKQETLKVKNSIFSPIDKMGKHGTLHLKPRIIAWKRGKLESLLYKNKSFLKC
jgi:hypothetical protein